VHRAAIDGACSGSHDGRHAVAFRRERDASLPPPVLLLPSLQVSIRAGALPEPGPNGVAYLRIPLDYLGRRRPSEVVP
jgi:hypothetical protein